MFSGLYRGHPAHFGYGLYRDLYAQLLVASTGATRHMLYGLHKGLDAQFVVASKGPLCTFVSGVYRGANMNILFTASTGAFMHNC